LNFSLRQNCWHYTKQVARVFNDQTIGHLSHFTSTKNICLFFEVFSDKKMNCSIYFQKGSRNFYKKKNFKIKFQTVVTRQNNVCLRFSFNP